MRRIACLRGVDLNKGNILMFKGISKVRILLPLNFKRIKKIFKIKPLTFKGFHKKSFEIQMFFKGYVIFYLEELGFTKNRHKWEVWIALFSLLNYNTNIHVKSWFPDTYKIMHYCTIWHTYNMVEMFVKLFSGKWWYCRYFHCNVI